MLAAGSGKLTLLYVADSPSSRFRLFFRLWHEHHKAHSPIESQAQQIPLNTDMATTTGAVRLLGPFSAFWLEPTTSATASATVPLAEAASSRRCGAQTACE